MASYSATNVRGRLPRCSFFTLATPSFPAVALILLICLLLSACGSVRTYPVLEQVGPVPSGLCRVAVLPFLNKSDYHLGDLLVSRIFTTQFLRSSGFEVVLEGDIKKNYRQMRIGALDTPNPEQLKILAQRLDVDGFITGEVVRMTEEERGQSINPQISLLLRFVDGASGRVFLTTYHKREGEGYRKVLHFGKINTITALVRTVSQEVIGLWQQKGLIPQCGS